MGVPTAHRDLEELLRSYGRVEMSAGHGEPLTAALRPGLEKNRSVGGYRGLELALGGANDWLRSWRSWEQGLADGEAKAMVNFGVDWWRSAVRSRE